MPSVGEFLRSHREKKSLSLGDIADATRISPRMLTALEEGRFSELPGGVFNVSFVRQYARYVGADADQAVALLRAETTTTPALPFSPEAGEGKDPYLASGPLGRIAEGVGGFLRNHGGTVSSLTVGLLLIVGGFYSYELWQGNQAEKARVAALEAARASVESREPKPAPVSLPAEPAKPQMPIELKVEITDTVWVRALADGERVLEGTYRAGDIKPISAREQVEIRVGNAAGVRLDLNGEELPSIGPRGHVRSLLVTPEGMEILDQEPKPASGDGSEHVPTTTASLRWAELAWSNAAR